MDLTLSCCWIVGFLVGCLLGDWRKGREEVARAAREKGEMEGEEEEEEEEGDWGSVFRICLS